MRHNRYASWPVPGPRCQSNLGHSASPHTRAFLCAADDTAPSARRPACHVVHAAPSAHPPACPSLSTPQPAVAVRLGGALLAGPGGALPALLQPGAGGCWELGAGCWAAASSPCKRRSPAAYVPGHMHAGLAAPPYLRAPRPRPHGWPDGLPGPPAIVYPLPAEPEARPALLPALPCRSPLLQLRKVVEHLAEDWAEEAEYCVKECRKEKGSLNK